jgi:TfoX/Sxy family transcriptional regulator of competence genes
VDGTAPIVGGRVGEHTAGVEIPRASEDDRAYFRALVPTDPRVEVKPMFGNLGAFVNGNMFMGLFGADVGVKLADTERARLLEFDGAGPFGPADRPMNGYVALPGVWRERPEEAAAWVSAALDHVGALAPKKPRTRKA